jgi:hypothetical protein
MAMANILGQQKGQESIVPLVPQASECSNRFDANGVLKACVIRSTGIA